MVLEITQSELIRNPEVLGPAIIAMKYKDGILIAAHSSGFYGSFHKYPNIPRVTKLAQNLAFSKIISL